MDLYGASVLHAYAYLFDDRFAATRNCYDPQFRGACDLYNGALEAALRIICKNRELIPGTSKTIHTAAGTWDITCVLRGGIWRPRGLRPLRVRLRLRDQGAEEPVPDARAGRAADRRAAELPGRAGRGPLLPARPELSRSPPSCGRCPGSGQAGRSQGLLELYDPLATTDTRVGHLIVPLESDLTTPLAYFLSKVPMESLATVGPVGPGEALRPCGPDRQTTDHGPVHGAALRAGQDPRAVGPRPVVQPR